MAALREDQINCIKSIRDLMRQLRAMYPHLNDIEGLFNGLGGANGFDPIDVSNSEVSAWTSQEVNDAIYVLVQVRNALQASAGTMYRLGSRT